VKRRRLALLLLALGLTAWLGFLRLPGVAGALLEEALATFFARPARVGSVHFQILPLQAVISDVRVYGLTPEAPPFLEVARVVVAPSLAQLWERRLAFSELRLESPTLRITAFAKGGDDIPRLGVEGGRGGEIRLDRLVISEGLVLIEHERVPVDVDLPDFQGRMDVRRDRALAGRVSFGPGALRFGSGEPLALGAELALVLKGKRLLLESGRLHAPRIDLEVRGGFTLASPLRGRASLEGPLDLAVLDQHVVRTGLGLEGAARFKGALTLEGSKVGIEGRVEGNEGRFAGLMIPTYASDVRWDGDGLRLSGLEALALGGSARLDVAISTGTDAPEVTLAGGLRGMDAEGLARLLFGWGAPGVGSAASGEFALSWPRGHPRALTWTVNLDLQTLSDGRTPLGGHIEWRADRGVQTVTKADLQTPMAHAVVAGRIGTSDEADLTLDAESTDLAAADALLVRVRRALGSVDTEAFGIAGTGTFRGAWRGTTAVPELDGRFQAGSFRYRGVKWGDLTAVGRTTSGALEAHSLVLRRGKSEIWLDGRFETGLLGEADAMDARARLSDWPAAELAQAWGATLDVTGDLTGEATLKGHRSAPSGHARLSAPEGRVLGLTVHAGQMEVLWGGGLVQVEKARADVGGGSLSFHGSRSDDGLYDGEIVAINVAVEEILQARAGNLAGHVSGELTLQGTLSRPRLRGQLHSARLFLGDEGLGAVDAQLVGTGDGMIGLEATCRSPRVDLSLSGAVGASPPHSSRLRLRARDTSVDPFLRVLAPASPAALGLVASGEIQVTGPFGSPREIHAEAELSTFQVLFAEYPASSPEPVRLSLANGQLTVERFHLAGEGTDLLVSGGAEIGNEGALALEATGAADLRFLSVASRQFRGTGAARLAMSVSGTRREPKVEGTLFLEGAGLRVRGFPHGLESLTGAVRFTERTAHLEDVKGLLAGGEISVEGQAAYAGAEVTSFDFRPRGQGLTLRYPEGLKSLVDADLRFFGDPKRHFLTGTLDIRQATYTKRYDVASELLSARPPPEEASSVGEATELDLKLRAPGTVHIDNNLAKLTARADLSLRGTTKAPVAIGRAEVERGRLYFQGRNYLITHGTLDFVNPTKLDPLFDIEAETRVRSYRVTLRVNGTLERVTPTLTSDPPLSAVQILNLLAGADETAVANITGTRSNESQLAAQGAASLAAGRLSEGMGLERGASKLLGLDRFSIDPAMLKGNGSTPTARVTVGKRITEGLSVLYSQDLTGSGERLLSIEYILSDRFSLLLTRSDQDGVGFDIRLRRSR
jgi:hypothetical protein